MLTNMIGRTWNPRRYRVKDVAAADVQTKTIGCNLLFQDLGTLAASTGESVANFTGFVTTREVEQ